MQSLVVANIVNLIIYKFNLLLHVHVKICQTIKSLFRKILIKIIRELLHKSVYTSCPKLTSSQSTHTV